mgnify:CR=1 FL=1
MATEQGQPAADKPANGVSLASASLAELKEHNPDLFKAAFAEGEAEGRKAGADAERERIDGVFHTPMAHGHPDLRKTLMFDGKTTAEQAALKVLEAEQADRDKTLSDYRADAPKPIDEPSEPDEGAAANAGSFDGLMEKYRADGMSRADAIRTIAREHPEVHEAHINKINGGK